MKDSRSVDTYTSETVHHIFLKNSEATPESTFPSGLTKRVITKEVMSIKVMSMAVMSMRVILMKVMSMRVMLMRVMLVKVMLMKNDVGIAGDALSVSRVCSGFDGCGFSRQSLSGGCLAAQ